MFQVKIPHFQGSRLSLVRELRSHMPHSTVKTNIVKQNKNRVKYYFCLWLSLKQVKTYKHGAVKL